MDKSKRDRLAVYICILVLLGIANVARVLIKTYLKGIDDPDAYQMMTCIIFGFVIGYLMGKALIVLHKWLIR